MRKLLLASLLLATGLAQAATYKLDPNHTQVIATWDHFGYSHPQANFGDVDGTLVYDAAKPEASSIDVTLPLSGLNALVPDLTKHLQSAETERVDVVLDSPTVNRHGASVRRPGGGVSRSASSTAEE